MSEKPIVEQVNVISWYSSLSESMLTFFSKKIPLIPLIDLSQTNILFHFTDLEETFQSSTFSKQRLNIVKSYYCSQTKETEFDYDGLKTRLVSFQWNEPDLSLIVQPVLFSEALSTNLYVDIHTKNEPHLRSVFSKEKKLISLDKSDQANHIGLNGMIVSSDNYTVFFKRSSSVAVNSNRIGPSVSGSMDYYKGVTIKNEIFKELREETGLDGFTEQLHMCALCRDLVFAGQPSFYFVITSSLTKAEIEEKIKTASDQYEHTSVHFLKIEKNTLKEEILGDDENKTYVYEAALVFLYDFLYG